MSSVQFKRGALIGFAVLLGGVVSSGAFAHEPTTVHPNAVKIDYSDLDLTQPEGVQALYRRVASAARQVCHEPSPREITRYARFEECFNETVTRAVDSVGVPQLTALHRERTSYRRAG